MNPDAPLISAPPGYTPLQDLDNHRPWYTLPRVRLFTLVFVFALVIGLVLTALQPSVYQSSATVLMTAAVAIDDDSSEANVQRVAIQRRVLLGSEVTRQVLDALHDDGYMDTTMAYLREVLQVIPVEDTNLVEMVAQGSESEIMPVLVGTWIEVYLAIRSAHVEQSQQQTRQVVEDQLADLEMKLADARQALADYREEHDISSAERQENEEMARLDGLNKALNRAVESEISAQAFVETLRKAIEAGKEVVPQSERESVEKMKRELAGLESKIKNLEKNYTKDFVRRNPQWRDIPDRMAELERELATTLAVGKQEALDQAEQHWAAAQQSVADLEMRLEEQKMRSARFTTIYATHQALVQDLEELEALNRETQSRLVQVEVNQVEKYPQVSVIDGPAMDAVRIGPDYRLWLGGTVGGALGLAILAVWLYGFLGPRQQPAFVTLSGVHMYPQDVAALGQQVPAQAQLPQASAPLLPQQESQDSGAPSSEGGDTHDSEAQDTNPREKT